MDVISTTNATLTAVAKALDYFKTNIQGHFSDTSLTGITKLTRSEPLTILSQDCANLTELPDIMSSLVNIYAGYYLQTVAILTRVNDLEVVKILDRLNPDRDSSGFLLGGRYATESIQTLVAENYKFSLPTKRVMALEAESDTTDDAMMDSANQKTMYENHNAAVGKLINVSITVNDAASGQPKSVNVPVSIRLSPAFLPDDTISHIFTHRKLDTGIVERFHAWRNGRIDFIRDGIFCQDLINEYRRAAIKDRTGTLNEIVRRVNNARSFGLLTKNPSLAVASNVYVLTERAAKSIEAKTGLRFNNHRDRAKLLEDTYAMIVAVVNPDWGQVSLYFNGIASHSTISLRSLKSGKDKGPDIADIMKSLFEGNAPSF